MFDFCQPPDQLTAPTHDVYWRLPMLPVQNLSLIVSKSKLVLKRCLLFLAYVKTIDVLTSQNFKGISPHFILYCDLVLCSR